MINLHPDGLAIGSLLGAHCACIGIVLIKRISISELDEANSFPLKEKYDCKQISDISYFAFLKWTICGVILEPHYYHDFCQTQNRFMATTHDRVPYDVPKSLDENENGTSLTMLGCLFQIFFHSCLMPQIDEVSVWRYLCVSWHASSISCGLQLWPCGGLSGHLWR